jgi:hypothetical protein
MCPRCYPIYGVGLGTGKGQKYRRTVMWDDEVKWEKIAG